MLFRHAALVAAVLFTASCGNDDNNSDASATTVTVAPVGTESEITTPPPASEAPGTTTEAPDTTSATSVTSAPVTSATSVTSTTGATTPAPTRFDEPGPFPIGVTTFALGSGPAVEIWYPAVEGTQGTVTYDVRDFTPPAIRELLTGDVPATFSIDGGRDADVADGTFPIVLFSHGSSAMRLQSSFLTSHLASHGMVVVAPDHPARDLINALGGRPDEELTDPTDDLLGALDLVLAENDDDTSRFAGRLDPTAISALGHSAGGGTIIGAALDDRVGAYVSMAAGGPDDASGFPQVPSLFLAGATDEIVPPSERTRPAFEAAATPSWYVEIAETGHNGFDDFCTFGGGTGIIGIAEASGLGPVLDAQPQLRRLGEDGCVPPAAPVDLAFPVIRHTTTSFLRWVFEIDPEPIGLDEATLADFELDVTTDRR